MASVHTTNISSKSTNYYHNSENPKYKITWPTSLVSLLSPQKIINIFKLEVSFELPSLVAPLSQQVDGIVQSSN